MADDREQRLKAGFALAKALGDPGVRAMFKQQGYVSEQQIVVALESDTVTSVFNRIQEYAPPVLVAIYWPAESRLEFAQMEPSSKPSDYTSERDDVGGGSTIGMLWEHTDRQHNAQYRFKLNWDAVATVSVARFDSVLA